MTEWVQTMRLRIQKFPPLPYGRHGVQINRDDHNIGGLYECRNKTRLNFGYRNYNEKDSIHSVILNTDTQSQIIEYYEVHNIPLFPDPDRQNPLLQSVAQSVVGNTDITANLIYHLTFRSLKANVKALMDFIDNGNYFENFPTVESYILTIDYTELTAALNTLNGVPCTPEGSFLKALSAFIKYFQLVCIGIILKRTKTYL